MQKRLDQFDGLRAYACLLIIANHTKFLNLIVGQMMVALFFALGGFFAVMPFAADNNGLARFKRPVNWLVYYVQRGARMLPMYWVLLLLMFFLDLFKGKQQGLEVLIDNLLFRNVNGHLWFVQQQMLMYLAVPFLLLLAYGFYVLLIKGKVSDYSNILLGLIFIVLGGLLHYYFRYVSSFRLLGNGGKQYWRIGLFVIGMGFGFLAKHFHGKSLGKTWQKILADLVILVILAIGATASSYHLLQLGLVEEGLNLGAAYSLPCALAFSLVFLLLMVNSEGLMAKFLSLPLLREIGLASYTIYLVQSVINRCVKISGGPTEKFVLVTIISVSIGYASYHLFEEKITGFVKRVLKRLS